MSECVVRMEMPSCCHDCPFEADQWDYPMCRVTGRSEGYRFDSRNNRMADCPIICQLPEGHGRLVDADELADDVRSLWDYKTVDGITATTVLNQTLTDIRNCPTIVPGRKERGMSELVDKDAFLKQERKWYCENCDRRKGVKNGRKCFVYEIGEVPCRACDVDDVLDDLEDFPTASPWHRVEETPKEYGNYLAVVNGEVMEVTYSDMRDDWKWSTCDAEGFVWIRSESVTHWMPLPEPPKEDA